MHLTEAIPNVDARTLVRDRSRGARAVGISARNGKPIQHDPGCVWIAVGYDVVAIVVTVYKVRRVIALQVAAQDCFVEGNVTRVGIGSTASGEAAA